MTMRWDCRDKGCYLNKSMWDWAIFDGCFGDTRVKPTDVDGLVERNGHFLLIETKGDSVGGLNRGQHITYKQAANLGRVTVLVLYGHRNNPTRMTVIAPGGDVTVYKDCTLEDVRAFVRRWWAAANGIEAA